MNRLERDIVCGLAEREGLRYRRVFAYAVNVEGYIFLDFKQARSFVEDRTNGKRQYGGGIWGWARHFAIKKLIHR